MYAPRHNISSKIPFPNAVIIKHIATNMFILLYSVPEKYLNINAIDIGNIMKGSNFISNLRGELNSLIFSIPISHAENSKCNQLEVVYGIFNHKRKLPAAI